MRVKNKMDSNFLRIFRSGEVFEGNRVTIYLKYPIFCVLYGIYYYYFYALLNANPVPVLV